MATKTEVDLWGHRLAYEAALTDIESNCYTAQRDGELSWYDAAEGNVDEEAAAHVKDAVAYLEARGLLLRHADHPDWVAVRDEDEGLAVSYDPEPLDAAGKVFLEPGDLLRIDGVAVAMEALVECVNPLPGLYFTAERRDDTVWITRYPMDAEAGDGR